MDSKPHHRNIRGTEVYIGFRIQGFDKSDFWVRGFWTLVGHRCIDILGSARVKGLQDQVKG